VYFKTVAAARIPPPTKYGVSQRHRRFYYTRDLIRRNLARAIDDDDRRLAIRYFPSLRRVTTRRCKNGTRLDQVGSDLRMGLAIVRAAPVCDQEASRMSHFICSDLFVKNCFQRDKTTDSRINA